MPSAGQNFFLKQALQFLSAVSGLNRNPCLVHVNAADTTAISDPS